MKPYRLSKSKLMSFRQCPKRLYLEVYYPELQEDDAGAARVMNQGNVVGEVARGVFSGGILIGHEKGMAAAVAETSDLLKTGAKSLLYEATFQHSQVLVRADVLTPVRGGVSVTEVKSSTSVKDTYVEDCAIQAYVIAGAGFPVKSVQLAYIDNTFVYPGNSRYAGLFALQDLSMAALGLESQVKSWIREAKSVLDDPEPIVEIGSHCNKPYECPFAGYCTPPGPEYPVSILPGARKPLLDALKAEGYEDLKKVPSGRLSNEAHERVRRVTLSGEPELDHAVTAPLKTLGYPRYYLDFETISFAVPIWKGTRPYQQLPFQWSCHIEARDGSLRHVSFLDTTGEPPMRPCIETLISTLGKRGPIFVYSNFEQTCLKAAAVMFPDLSEAIASVLARLVDLFPIVRQGYYHPAMRGSWSIKALVPTIASELDYGNLGEVRDGGGAQDSYLELIAKETKQDRQEALRDDLLDYCKRDTLAMVAVFRALTRFQ